MNSFISALPGVFDAIEASDEVKDAFVFAAWRHVAGAQVFERTSPMAVEGSRLLIAVADKTWKRNLESLASQLLFRLNSVLGKPLVDYIEFCVAPSEIMSRDRKAEEGREVPLDLPKELSTSASRIRDEELREKVLKAAASCLSRKHTYSYMSSDKIN